MKKLLLMAFLSFIGLNLKAQIKSVPPDPTNDTTIYSSVQVIPQFPDGMVKFYQYVTNSLKSTGDKGFVYVIFIVEKDGSLSNITVPMGLSEIANNEAIRVISQSPKWIPGEKDGHPVRVRFTVPLHFS